MSFGFRLVVVALAAFAAASLVTAAIVPLLGPRRLPNAPERRAAALLRWRLWPFVFAAASMLLALASFLEFEPRAEESTGIVLQLLAATSAVLIAGSGVRVLRAVLRTRRAVRHWMASAEPIALRGALTPAYAITSSFPVVAVVGLLRPRLVIARSVLDACSADQLRAIVAHENGHVRRHDNARSALIGALPDVLTWLPLSRVLADRWRDATEEAADHDAGRLESSGRLHLAEALIRVARLAPTGVQPTSLPASALYRGENLELRVSRLLEPAIDETEAPASAWRRFATAAAILVVSALALRAIHEVVEIAVTFLP